MLLGSMIRASLIDERLFGLALVTANLDIVVALSQHMLILVLAETILLWPQTACRIGSHRIAHVLRVLLRLVHLVLYTMRCRGRRMPQRVELLAKLVLLMLHTTNGLLVGDVAVANHHLTRLLLGVKRG